jgi:hypothetical protein
MASLTMAISPTVSAHSPADLALTASFFLVLLGWTPSLILSLLGHAAGWLLLVSLSGAAWMIWLLSVG